MRYSQEVEEKQTRLVLAGDYCYQPCFDLLSVHPPYG